jgi:hypothetical protein
MSALAVEQEKKVIITVNDGEKFAGRYKLIELNMRALVEERWFEIRDLLSYLKDM